MSQITSRRAFLIASKPYKKPFKHSKQPKTPASVVKGGDLQQTTSNYVTVLEVSVCQNREFIVCNVLRK